MAKLLIRCPECNRENYAPAVPDAICCWCGFDGRDHGYAYIDNAKGEWITRGPEQIAEKRQ